MIRKDSFPLKKLKLYYTPEKLTMQGGTIESAIFENKKLLEYKLKFPKDFDFPPGFHKIEENDTDNGYMLVISQNNSDKNEMIFTGISSNLYSTLMSKGINREKIKKTHEFRFQILLEQQSIISLVSVLETFIKSVQDDFNQSPIVNHNFEKIRKRLKKCEIIIQDLELLNDRTIYKRTEEIINYSFYLRNLFVHNGGIVDKYFCKQNQIDEDKIGKLIRINYNDFVVIRQWISVFIQEVCRVIEGYEDVWTDYLLSTGILLSSPTLILKLEDGTDFEIVLKDGVELIGEYEDEDLPTDVKNFINKDDD